MAARLDACLDQAVAREAAPQLEIDGEPGVAADDREDIARTQPAQRGNQLRQQARGEGPGAGIELAGRAQRHGFDYSRSLREFAEPTAAKSCITG
jgi:hypothetical protein